MTKCKFPTTRYYDFERKQYVDWNCDSKDEDILPSGLCIFHDENYLKEDEDNRKEREQKVKDILMDKIRKAVAQNEALLCIGYHLSDIAIREENFSKPVYFIKCVFQGVADFSKANFQGVADFSKATFTGAYFQQATFTEAYFQQATFSFANFQRAKFSKLAYFHLATFSGEAYFSFATFSGQTADFYSAKFTRRAYFTSATFSVHASFHLATFSGEAYFYKSKFYGAANFSKSEFFATVYFYKTTFCDKITFKEAVFSNFVSFRKSTFLSEADLREVTFNGRAYFDFSFFEQVDFYHSTFNDMVYFGKSTFAVFVGFRRVTFSNDLDFGGAGFFCDTIFTDCKFSNNVNFYHAIFSGHTRFLRTRFLDIANFRGCLFSGEIIFDISKFSGEVFFIKSTFSGKIVFLQSIFCSEVSFGAAEFSGVVNFLRAKFSRGAFFSDVNFSGRTNFNQVLFENGERVLFDVKNLANVSFLDTDITKVRFSDYISWGNTTDGKFKIMDEESIEWSLQCLFNWNSFPNNKDIAKFKDFLKWVGYNVDIKGLNFKKDDANTITIYRKTDDYLMVDAAIKLNSDKTIAKMTNGYNFSYDFMAKEENGTINIYGKRMDLGSVKAVYRNLRENYEYRLRYDEAGQFFIREMELKRKYREVCSKDESNSIVIKPNGWFRRNLSLTGLYYRLAKYGEDLRRPAFFGLTIVAAAVIAYMLIQQPLLVTHPLSLGYKGLSPIGNAFENSTTVFLQLRNEHLVWYDYIFKSLGILTLGIFAIPLRRRFERKFRH